MDFIKMIIHKRILSPYLIVVLIFTLSPYVPTVNAEEQKKNTSQVSDAALDQARKDFYDSSGSSSGFNGLDVINIDNSKINHKPQEYPEPEEAVPTAIRPFADHPVSYNGPFEVGDTRSFWLNDLSSSTQTKEVKGYLISQGSNTNIWILDDDDYHNKTGTTHNAKCHIKDITDQIGENLASEFDTIYSAMTNSSTGFAPFSNVSITTGYGNMPVIGDLGIDGKINFLLYDIDGDGGSTSSYTAGFFFSGDFFTSSSHNALDMLHIDIGDGQGFDSLTGSETEKLTLYSTLSHEFQHMLYYMYYGVYSSNKDAADDDSWFNESLSALAEGFYVRPGTEVVNMNRLFSAAENPYDNYGYYSDFFNHVGLKNYGVERLFSHLMAKNHKEYPTKIYDHLRSTYPPAQNYNDVVANGNKITSMQQAIGDILKAGTGVGNGSTDTFSKIYYLFMEAFAADGGVVHDTDPVSTTKFYPGTDPVNNLWAVRQVTGLTNGRVFLYAPGGTGGFYSLNNLNKIPTLNSGGQVSLKGYGTTPAKGATHEMFYKLAGESSSNTILNIKVPADTSSTKYYIAVPKNKVISNINSTYSSGESGADLYPMEKGQTSQINTNGMPAYLYVVTYYQNVNINTITYNWITNEENDDDETTDEKTEIPVAADFTINGNIKKYNGKEHRISVKPLDPDLQISSVYYTGANGTTYLKSTMPPVNAGSYTITIDTIASGKYKAVKNLDLGTLAINKASISEIKTSVKDGVWSGKQLKPTVTQVFEGQNLSANTDITLTYGTNTDVGFGSVTLTGKGNFTDTINLRFKILPGKNSISKIKPGKKSMTVTWAKANKAQKITKYEIRYKIKNSSKWETRICPVSSNKTVLKSLKKGKKYQVQIRSYKEISGVKFYSEWSSLITSKKIK